MWSAERLVPPAAAGEESSAPLTPLRLQYGVDLKVEVSSSVFKLVESKRGATYAGILKINQLKK